MEPDVYKTLGFFFGFLTTFIFSSDNLVFLSFVFCGKINKTEKKMWDKVHPCYFYMQVPPGSLTHATRVC